MDSGNETDTKEEVVPPVEAVVANTEITETKPQVKDTELQELYVEEDEGDQEKPKSNMSQEQAYAAFRKEQKKRQRKNIELEEKETEIESLKTTVEELQSTVGGITRGEMPDRFDFESDDDFITAIDKWKGASKPVKAKAKVEQQDNTANDEADFYLHQQEQELIKALPEYEETKKALIETFRTKFKMPNPEGAITYLSNIAKQSGIDIAKALVAIEKIPALVDKLGATNNPFETANILKEAAGKIKTRSKKNIETQPEPEINNSGQIDSSAGTVEKLRKAWVANSTKSNYDKYQAAKQKVKANG